MTECRLHDWQETKTGQTVRHLERTNRRKKHTRARARAHRERETKPASKSMLTCSTGYLWEPADHLLWSCCHLSAQGIAQDGLAPALPQSSILCFFRIWIGKKTVELSLMLWTSYFGLSMAAKEEIKFCRGADLAINHCAYIFFRNMWLRWLVKQDTINWLLRISSCFWILTRLNNFLLSRTEPIFSFHGEQP